LSNSLAYLFRKLQTTNYTGGDDH